MTKSKDFMPADPSVTPRFAGVATFMRTVSHEISEDVDIGLVGVPFDLGLNHRTGARQGPAGVREMSRLIRRVHPTSGIRPFEICNVPDWTSSGSCLGTQRYVPRPAGTDPRHLLHPFPGGFDEMVQNS